MNLVTTNLLSKKYGQKVAVDSVNLELGSGQHYSIQGNSGSGKSTLLYLLGGLEEATSGQITVDNMNLEKCNDEELALYRNQFVGFIFQFHFLLPTMNCLENILLPAKIAKKDRSKVKKRVMLLAKELKVDDLLEKFP